MTKVLRNLVALAAVTFAFAAHTARAAGAPINGAFNVTFSVAAGQAVCPGILAVEAHGLGQTAQGPMFFTIKKCFDANAGTFAGTFALCTSNAACTADSSDAVSGTYAGKDDGNVAGFTGVIFGPFHGTLTINRDNRNYGVARGAINFTAITGWLAPTSFPVTGSAYYVLRETGRDHD